MSVTIHKVTLGGLEQDRPFVIAGPCSAESREQVLSTADALAAGGIRIFRSGVWKPRTKPGGFEGAGSAAFAWLQEARERTGMKLCTEVATAAHVEEALKAGMDLLWIGARTTANPFAVQELSDALRGTEIPVLVKNPINPDIDLWCGAIERLSNAGVCKIGIIHRGFSAYEKNLYRNLPLWHIPIEMKRRYPEITLICDPSHMGGNRELVAPLAQQALDLMYDGLMIESHCHPECALSDARQQLTPSDLFAIIRRLVVRDDARIPDGIGLLREQIDELDSELVALLAKRQRLSNEIGDWKIAHNMPVLQSGRYREIIERLSALASKQGLDPAYVTAIMETIHRESIRQQMKQQEKVESAKA